MKKFVTLLLAVCLMLTLCSGALAAEKNTIALCIAQTTNEFQSQIVDAINAYAEREGLTEKYDLTLFDAQFDTAKQLEQV